MTTESDRLLVQSIRLKDGSFQDSWATLVERYTGRLQAYVRRRLRDGAAVDDVVQETFIGFQNSIANYDDKRDLQTWLFTIASHKVTDQLRRMGRRPYATGSEADEEQMGNAADGRQRAASSHARSKERRDLESTAVARGLQDMIRQWQRDGEYVRIQVLELLFVKGWANKTVAEFLKVTEQQVANYRFAAVRKLHESAKGVDLPAEIFPELHAQG
jgi:RNA polymerase sigma-70 factor (ECF subfamily)